MAKPRMDHEINLIELIQIFWHHRIKFIVMTLLCLILGLIFTFSRQPIFSTDFKFFLGHPIIENSLILESSLLQSKLNESELNKAMLPNYSYDSRKNLFTVKSKTAEIQTPVELFLRTALTNELNQLKTLATSIKGNSENRVIFDTNNRPTINFSNQDIANLIIDDVLDSLVISFSKAKLIYPHPFKHGLIGVFIGLVLGFVWMVLAILISKMKAADPRREV